MDHRKPKREQNLRFYFHMFASGFVPQPGRLKQVNWSV